MRIVLHDYGGYSFIFTLSRALSELGYSVVYIYSSASGSPSGVSEKDDMVTVIDLGVDLPLVDKGSFFNRFRQESFYGNLISLKIEELSPDLVISANTPLEAQKKISRVCRRNNIYLIHWLQDILSLAAESVVKKKSPLLAKFVGSYFRRLERKCLLSADHVIAISQDFSYRVKDWGVPAEKISVIENWSDLNAVPLVGKNNSFSRRHRLDRTVNIVYSGTLGMKQNPDVLLSLALCYRENSQLRIVVVANGTGVPYLKARIIEHKLTNVLILPLQPFELLPEVLGCADLLVAILEKDASVYCVPSKILTYYCAGKPSLLVMSKNNLAARTTLDHELGFVVDPDDLDGLRPIVNRLLEAPETMTRYGERARNFAELNFPIKRIANRFIGIINRLKS